MLLAITAILLNACGELAELPTGPGEPLPDPSATLARVQSEIFTPSCASIGCHDAAGQQQGLILTPGRTHAMVVGRASTQVPSLSLVEPRDPANSYLYRKLTGGAVTGERMPAGGPYLDEAQLSLVRDWIRRGAPDD